MWNPFEPNARNPYQGRRPASGFRGEDSTSAPPAVEQYPISQATPYSLDTVVQRSPNYAHSYQNDPRPVFTRRIVNSDEIERLFNAADQRILHALLAHAGQPITLDELTQLNRSSRRTTQINNIPRINTILKREGFSQILTIGGNANTASSCLLESPQSAVIRSSHCFELRQHSFACQDITGNFHEFAVRAEDFYILQELIDHLPHTASLSDLHTILSENGARRPNDREQIRSAVRRLNTLLGGSGIWIENNAPAGSEANYLLLTPSPQVPATPSFSESSRYEF